MSLALLPAILALQDAATAVRDVEGALTSARTWIIITLMALVAWFLRRLLSGFEETASKQTAQLEELKKTCIGTNEQVTAVRHELFGVSGQNGLRSEVRRMSQQLDEHDLLLLRLAQHSNVSIPERAR